MTDDTGKLSRRPLSGNTPAPRRPKVDPRTKSFFSSTKAYRAWLNGKSFVVHTAELLASKAWRALGLYEHRLIDRLELEHAHHNGLENGFLKLTYRQMREAGIHGDVRAATIANVEALGLVTVTHRRMDQLQRQTDPRKIDSRHPHGWCIGARHRRGEIEQFRQTGRRGECTTRVGALFYTTVYQARRRRCRGTRPDSRSQGSHRQPLLTAICSATSASPSGNRSAIGCA